MRYFYLNFFDQHEGIKMAIKQMIDAKDWFFVNELNLPHHQALTVWYVAAWALHDDGKIIGMISVPNSDAFHTNEEGKSKIRDNWTARLVTVPPTGGIYKHREELTEEEKKALANNGCTTTPGGYMDKEDWYKDLEIKWEMENR